MKTLKLFNAVIRIESSKPSAIEDGVFIESGAIWAKERILKFYKENRLSADGLNKTFYTSWNTVLESSRFELLLDQMLHYISTYGTGFTGEIYLPKSVVDIEGLKPSVIVVRSFTKQEITNKCLDMLRSGIALQEETVDDILSILTDECQFVFTGEEGIKNIEALVKIADMYGVIPKDTLEFFRYIIYRATESTLLIKNDEAIQKIKDSKFNPGVQFENFGLQKLATIFNRFKPLFLAFKNKCPRTINKIAKLSKVLHVPMVQNPLNLVTQRDLNEGDMKWIDNATTYSIAKASNALWTRMLDRDTFTYKVRNGKSYTKAASQSLKNYGKNFMLLDSILVERVKKNVGGKKVYLPINVSYGLPTSEKMFIGNIPVGTTITAKSLAVGVYWENDWGARDIDLAGISEHGKIGWNSSYYTDDKAMIYSGDITSAPNGAVEYIYGSQISSPTIVTANIFSGDEKSFFKTIIGVGDDIDKEYMMNPQNLLFEAMVQSVKKETILGVLTNGALRNTVSFTFLNVAGTSKVVSGGSEVSNLMFKALIEESTKSLTLNQVLAGCNCIFVSAPEEADISLDLKDVTKDTFIALLS